MSSPEQQRRRGRSASSTSSSPSVARELLSPSDARKTIKNLLIDAIDKVADTLKQIPRAPSSVSSSSSSLTTLTTTESRSVGIDEKPKRTTFGEKELKNRRRQNDRNGIDLMSASSPTSQSNTSMSASENMYTRGANVESPKTNSKKINNKYRDEESVSSPITTSTTTISATRKKQHQTSTTLVGQKISPNTIIIQNIEEDAKGITLKFNVKMIKPDGSPKIIDFAIEMPDFEPTFVKVGNKTAFLE